MNDNSFCVGFCIYTCSNPAELAARAARKWLDWLPAAQKRRAAHDRIRVALSGGRITKTFYQEVVRQCTDPALFDNVHFFWADERCVPPSDPESNFALARDFLFKPLNIPDTQIHRLRGEGDEAEGLRLAIAEISDGALRANGQPILDLVFLGMGENGHTASLFPEETPAEMALTATYRAVTATKPPPRRFTLGYGTIAVARELWALISGQGKEAAFAETMYLGPEPITPLGRVFRMNPNVTIFTDILPPKPKPHEG